MKTLLCATLAALLVAAVTAQSSQQADDASSVQGLVEKISAVVSSLGGFDGTMNKLEHITKLVKKAYSDKGIGGWMARNLIKLELSQLKERALSTEKDMINHVLDNLESEVGLRSYSATPTGNYILSETVKNAIAFIRKSIQEVLGEISEAQKDHDDAVGEMSTDAMNKITERLSDLKEKLRGLSKKLLDKLTGRDRTAQVYSGNAGVRAIRASGDSYIFNEVVKVAAQQLRERIFKYVELMGEAKREVQKAYGKHKEQALAHLEKLKERLRESVADLKDTLLGKKTKEELEKEIKEDETSETLNAMRLMRSANYIQDFDLAGKLREKIADLTFRMKAAADEVLHSTGEAKERAKARLAALKEAFQEARNDLLASIFGRPATRRPQVRP